MAIKYRVSATFDLATEIEPENVDRRIDDVVADLGDDFEGGSYFSTQPVTADGGQVAVTIEAEDEDEAEQKLREVLDDGFEFEDYNGFTWLVESLQVEAEPVEWVPTVEEALDVLSEFIDQYGSGTDENLARVATAAGVVIDHNRVLNNRVAELATQVREDQERIAGLSESVRRLTEMVEALQRQVDGQSAQ